MTYGNANQGANYGRTFTHYCTKCEQDRPFRAKKPAACLFCGAAYESPRVELKTTRLNDVSRKGIFAISSQMARRQIAINVDKRDDAKRRAEESRRKWENK